MTFVRTRGALAATVLLAALMCAPAVARAVEVVPLAPPGTTDVQIWPGAEPGREVTVVSVTVPESTKLPVRVRIPIPTGEQVLWAGEILGGDPSKDPKRSYKVADGVKGTFAEFTIEKARTGQIETVGDPIRKDGETSTVDTQWVQSTPSSLTGFALRLPAGATSVVSTPTASGSPDKNAQGETLWPLPSANFTTGQAETITASWKISAVTPQQRQQAPSSAPNVIPIILGVLAVAIGILVIVLVRQRRSGPPSA